MDEGEKGGDLFLNVNPYLDYVSRKWSHTFAASVQADYFLNNDNMPLLDTNDWNLVLGLEYTLIGRGMLLDVGYDFNIEGEELSSDFLLWFEKDWYRFEKQRIGTVAWAFYRTSGPMSFALYASWHRTAAEGLNGTVYLGAKFEADSAFDYKALDQSLKEYGQAYEEYYQKDLPFMVCKKKNGLKWAVLGVFILILALIMLLLSSGTMSFGIDATGDQLLKRSRNIESSVESENAPNLKVDSLLSELPVPSAE